MENEDEDIYLVPKMEVCSWCNGRGKSSAYLGAFTQSDMDEQGPEFMEDYMNGEYDRTCEKCKGTNVIEVPDPDRNTPELIEAYENQQLEKYMDYRTQLAESGIYSDDGSYYGGW
jgi:RecJ-like exonuclease